MSSYNHGRQDTKGVFIGVKPKVSHFFIFSYPFYINVPTEKKTKLDPSNYSETSKAYREYIPRQRKIGVSKDVKFEEDFASRKSHEPIPITKDEELKASKVDLGSTWTSREIQRPSSEEEKIVAPSTSSRRPQWTQTLKDA